MNEMIARPRTAAEFLGLWPVDHPDLVWCGDPRMLSENKAGDPDHRLILPNLTGLVGVAGGPTEIPDWSSEVWRDALYTEDSGWGLPAVRRARNQLNTVTLQDVFDDSRHPGHVRAQLARSAPNRLVVSHWHPSAPTLTLTFTIPSDWAAGI